MLTTHVTLKKTDNGNPDFRNWGCRYRPEEARTRIHYSRTEKVPGDTVVSAELQFIDACFAVQTA
jgi:hypothetical protein